MVAYKLFVSVRNCKSFSMTDPIGKKLRLTYLTNLLSFESSSLIHGVWLSPKQIPPFDGVCRLAQPPTNQDWRNDSRGGGDQPLGALEEKGP